MIFHNLSFLIILKFPNHQFQTGQKVLYNVGLGGSSLYVSDFPDPGFSFPIPDNEELYIVNKGKDFIGLSTLGFTTSSGIGTNNNSLYIYQNNSTTGFAHSFSLPFSKTDYVDFIAYQTINSFFNTPMEETSDSLKLVPEEYILNNSSRL